MNRKLSRLVYLFADKHKAGEITSRDLRDYLKDFSIEYSAEKCCHLLVTSRLFISRIRPDAERRRALRNGEAAARLAFHRDLEQ